MSQLSIVVAARYASPAAFSVFRGFEESIPQIAGLGYNGIELALKDRSEIDQNSLDKLLEKYNLTVSAISTGRVFSESGLMFTCGSREDKKKLVEVFTGIIDLAACYGGKVNIGRVRGSFGGNDRKLTITRFSEMASRLSEYALKKNVTLLLEPVNRYEIDFINSLRDGAELLKSLDLSNMKIMADVFHMNIEDRTIGGEIIEYIDHISYIHLADSNRLAPGWGHTDFEDIFSCLRKAKYSGWFSVEILPVPDPASAARQAVEYLNPLIRKYNFN